MTDIGKLIRFERQPDGSISVQAYAPPEIDLFVRRVELVEQLLWIADEASAANSLGLTAEALDALRRYHALRTEHASTVDIRVL